MEEERQPLLAHRPRARWYHFTGDMFNTLKAFIGTNYLALAFAFKQSGLVFGIVGVFLIACLTDHCCRLMVRTKYFVIDILMEEEISKRASTAQELEEYRANLERTLGYGDLGRIALGKWCAYVIDFAVWFTQFLTIVAYFIFLANTIYTLFPLQLTLIPLNQSKPVVSSDTLFRDASMCPVDGSNGLFYDSKTQVGIPVLNLPNLQKDHEDCELSTAAPVMQKRSARDWKSIVDSKMGPEDDLDVRSFSSRLLATNNRGQGEGTNETISTTAPTPANVSTFAPNTTTVSPVSPNTTTTPMPTPVFYWKSIAPDMRLLFFIPLPFFLCTSLIRELRILSPLTVVATIALFLGAFSVLGFEISGFTKADDMALYKWATLPVFIGQLISAYEGIGCILPIEASMEGNRWAFPLMLRSSVYIVFVILTAFGSVGYLRYGEGVKQLITLSIKQHTPLSIMVDVTLIVSVLFTYPLQCFPVLTITEKYLIAPGGLFGPRVTNASVRGDGHGADQHNIQTEQSRGLLDSTSSDASEHSDVAVVVPDEIPAWKRNVLRIIVTLCAMGTAVALWDAYAYVGAVSGAVGCSLLAYILPCLIHLKVKGRIMRVRLIIKDLLIIFVSAVASVSTLVVIIGEIAKGTIK